LRGAKRSRAMKSIIYAPIAKQNFSDMVLLAGNQRFLLLILTKFSIENKILTRNHRKINTYVAQRAPDSWDQRLSFLWR
jgi:hypothetical protein